MAERGFPQIRRLALSILIILYVSLAQFHQLSRDLRFQPDEAFFMTFARGAAVNGDWLLPGPLDKPPLSMYFSALSMVLVGNRADADGVLQLDPHVGEFAGALPNAFSAILLTALMMRLARRLFRCEWAAALAGLLTASSPYLLTYGASAFTDMTLVFWSVAALCFALTGRWALAGAALGLAFWSKQQAAIFAVWIVMILLARGTRQRDWLRLALSFCATGGALLIWDGARTETSIFLQAAVNNAPGQLMAEPTLWHERLAEWTGLGMWLLGPPLVTGLLLAGMAIAWIAPEHAPTAGRQTLALERVMLLYSIGFVAIHTVFAFNLYDRYLLLILPPLILVVAGRLARLRKSFSLGRILYIVSAILLTASTLLNTGEAIGDAHRAHDGIDALAAHLNAKPVATVIYDPWLGWQLGYYLGQWQDKRRVHYPTAEALVAGALALDEIGDRYFVAPIDQPHDDWLAALREVGFGVQVDYERDRYIAYRLRQSVN